MSARQLIVLAAAVIAAMAALFLIRSLAANAKASVEIAEPGGNDRMIAAARGLPLGATLAPSVAQPDCVGAVTRMPGAHRQLIA